MTRASSADQKFAQLPIGRIRAIHLWWLFLIFGASAFAASAQNGTGQLSIVKTIIAWTPLLLKGFGFNILISFMSMAIGSVIGLSLPVMANVAEIVRGAVNSIPSGQWEASESLAFTRRQQIWLIILPQCYKRMLPPWMNLYAILTMATVLASIVGVEEVMTLAGQVLAAEGRPELLVPIYSFVLVWFFAYCYPIARWTIWLERKFALKL